MNNAGLGGLIRRHLALLGLVLAFAAMLAVFSVMSPVFFTYGNFINIANQTAVISVLAIGMTLVMLSGGIDLSVGAVVSLSAVVCALLLDSGMGLPLAIGLSILLGVAVGAINGIISVRWGIQTFLVTLGSLSVARGLSLVLSDGRTIYIESERFLAITAQGFIGPIPVLFAWTLLFFAAVWVLLNLTTFGRKVRAVGGNVEAARQAGLNTQWVVVRVFMLSGGLAACAGLMMAGRLSSGLPSVGVGMELDAIAAAVLGGTGFKGEGGSLAGTLFGALVMGTVINGLTVLGIDPYIQEITKGVVIVLAVIIVSKRR
ncbi:MAG TPA: ABC transporter permease [Xanthomonadales bacterium]|nr:ABC transporter permease [Xanthomonadales bacterium]